MEIQGPAGWLEARHDVAPIEKTITTVLCHPHPQYGGSMHDAVLETATQEFLKVGANCLRFNFRGVGGSDGAYDGNGGEVDDLAAAIAWAREEYPRDKLWLAGYSFGANVVWQALKRESCAVERALLIAPPVGMMSFETGGGTHTDRLQAIAGSADDFVDQATFTGWDGVETHVLQGADHFFGGHHDVLAAQIAALLADD